VELLFKSTGRWNIFIGISRPNLDPAGPSALADAPEGEYWEGGCTDAWFIDAFVGSLCGNGKYGDHEAGPYKQGDRVGVLLDLDNGSLRFFKNGVEHGPGYDTQRAA
jgi:hypothetical protein